MVDHTRLVDRIAERLQTDVVSVSAGLQELLEALHRELQQHGKAHLAGLGEFRLTEGKLVFEPDAELADDVNFRYSGLEPVVIAGSENTVITDNTAAEESIVFVVSDAPEPEFVHTTLPESESDPESIADTVVPEAETLSVPENGDPITIPKTISLRVPDRHHNKPSEAKSKAGLVAAIMIILLLVAGGVWYAGMLKPLGVPDVSEVLGQKSVNTQTPPEVSQTPEPTSPEMVTDTVIADSLITETPQVPDPAQVRPVAERFSLFGEFDTTVVHFHTIVSGTFFTRNGADEALDSAQVRGWRSRLRRVTVQQRPAWELQLGQFETRPDAREANQELDRKFQSDVIRQYGQQ